MKKQIKAKDIELGGVVFNSPINELMKAVCEIYDILASNSKILLISTPSGENFQKLKNITDKFREEII